MKLFWLRMAIAAVFFTAFVIVLSINEWAAALALVMNGCTAWEVRRRKL